MAFLMFVHRLSPVPLSHSGPLAQRSATQILRPAHTCSFYCKSIYKRGWGWGEQLNKNLSSDPWHLSKSNKPGVMAAPLISALGRWRLLDLCEFQASLIYSENSSSNSSGSVLCLRMQSGQGRIQPACKVHALRPSASCFSLVGT